MSCRVLIVGFIVGLMGFVIVIFVWFVGVRGVEEGELWVVVEVCM